MALPVDANTTGQLTSTDGLSFNTSCQDRATIKFKSKSSSCIRAIPFTLMPPRPHGTINRSAKPVVLPVVIFRSPRTLSKNSFIMSNNQEPFLISAQESKIPKSFIPQKNDHKVFERGSKKSLRFGAFNSEEKAVS